MRKITIACSAFLAAMVVPISAFAQSYRVTEDYKVDANTADAGPVRMARFASIQGKVAWRPSVDSEWSAAKTNLPCRQGAQVMVSPGGRCELQFDDGSILRMGSGSFVTLTTLYSDANGEFTEAKLNDGLATFDLRNKYSLYQVDTPEASVKAYGPASLRFGVGKGLEVADRQGECEVDNSAGKNRLGPNQYAYLPSPTSQMRVAQMPKKDNWDEYNDERENYWSRPSRYEPSNIGLVSGDLDNYGAWRSDPHYGQVWYPTEASNWRPYNDGSWTWVSPYGWTWVGNEPWGWAPYHYGAWIHTPYGWAWRPGPEAQYWSPAVVRFTDYGDDVAWCPLDPDECYYPDQSSFGFSLAIGGGDWGLFFSIGRSGCYFPAGPTYCEARPWSNVWVNQATNFYSPAYINNYYGGYNTANLWRTGSQFNPRYAQYGTFTNRNGFVNGARYRPIGAQQVAMFQRGRGYTGAPAGNDPQIFGPANLRPSRLAYAPTRQTVAYRPNAQVANRPVFRSAVPNTIARQTMAMGRTIAPRSAFVARNAFTRPANGTVQGARAQRMTTQANRMQRYNNLSKSPFTRQSTAMQNRRNTTAMRQRSNLGRTAQVRNRQARPILPNMHRTPGRNAARTTARANRPNFGATHRGATRSANTVRRTSPRAAARPQRMNRSPRPTYRPQQRTIQRPRQQIHAPRQSFAPRQNFRPQRINPAPRQQFQPRQQFHPQPRQNFRPSPSPRQNRPAPQRSNDNNRDRGHGG